MDQAEASGRTVDDALNRALAQLGATRNDVDQERIEFKVLDEGRKGGLFGRGARDAVVEAWWAGKEGTAESRPAPAPPARSSAPSAPPPTAPRNAAPTAPGQSEQDAAGRRRRGGRGRGGRSGEPGSAASSERGGGDRGGSRHGYEQAVPKLTDADFMRPKFGAGETAPEPGSSERAPRAPRSGGNGRGPGRPSGDSRPQQVPSGDRRPPRERRRPEEGPEVAPDINAPEVDFAAQTVDDLLRIFQIDAEISIREPLTPGDGLGSALAVIDIKGDDLGVLIGRRGDTLIAMQYLVNLILSRHFPGKGAVTIDVEHYRHRNEERIISLAKRMADRVRETGAPITLEPMSPAERRLVHLVFHDDPEVETNSVGEGEHRKVVISRR